MKRQIAILATLLAILGSLCVSACAQNKADAAANLRQLRNKQFAQAVEEARAGRPGASKEAIEAVNKAYQEEAAPNDSEQNSLTGTWYITAPGSTPDEATLYAYQTFGADGTFVETSSLLGMLPEGPAHGVWARRKRGFVLTFELFAFDENGAMAGRIRVRNAITLNDFEHFTSNSVVDFIELDGTVIENIASGPFTAERVRLRGL